MLLFPSLDLFEPRLVFGFKALFRRAVVRLTREGIGQTLHVGQLIGSIVSILIALSVLQLFHQAGGRVADDERHGFGQMGERILFGTFVGQI